MQILEELDLDQNKDGRTRKVSLPTETVHIPLTALLMEHKSRFFSSSLHM